MGAATALVLAVVCVALLVLRARERRAVRARDRELRGALSRAHDGLAEVDGVMGEMRTAAHRMANAMSAIATPLHNPPPEQ